MSAATRCTRKKLEYHKNCSINPKCCLRPNELECAGDFIPPLLGTSTEFCKEALAKGLPIPECTLAKPQKLTISTQPMPEETPPTHRCLKNWQKWCRVWKRNQDQLANVRQADTNPPLMTCGEGFWYKKEDAELFERTLQMYYNTGYNIKNATRPEGCRPGQKDLSIQEKILPKHFHIYPEMKRYRYAKRIRDELGLSYHCPSPRDMPSEQAPHDDEENSEQELMIETQQLPTRIDLAPTGRWFNWEKPWLTSEFCRVTKQMKKVDLPPTMGHRRPKPTNLILEAPKHEGISGTGNDFENANETAKRNVPELTFSLDDQKKDTSRVNSARDSEEKDYYNETRGPVLHVVGKRAEIRLSYKPPKPDDDYMKKLPLSKQFFIEDLEVFSATTKGKETRHVSLKNGGTTAIRYQWLRFPPNNDTRQMLGNPARYLALGNCEKNTKKKGLLHSEKNEPKQEAKVHKPTSLEFRFKEGPSVLLPGQSLEFPIVFRSQKPGYYHEALYLLTHPKLCDDNGRTYCIRLTGVCMDPDLTEADDDPFRPENVKEAVKQTTLEQEAADIIDSILDHAVFIEKEHTPTLPFGRVTTENIFYTHNKHFRYHYGFAEKSLQTVRTLVELLVPQERMLNNENICTLSIQSLYKQLLTASDPRDLYWSHFKSPQTENLLKKLAESNNVLNEPRRYVYPSKETRQKMVCETSIATFIDELLLAMENIDELYDTPELKKIYKEKAKFELQAGGEFIFEDEPNNIEELVTTEIQIEGQKNEEEEAGSNDEEMQEAAEETVEIEGAEEEVTIKPKNKNKAEKPESPSKKDQTENSKGKGKKKEKRTSRISEDKDAKTEYVPEKKSKKKLKGVVSQAKTKTEKISSSGSPEEEEAQNNEEETDEFEVEGLSEGEEKPNSVTPPPSIANDEDSETKKLENLMQGEFLEKQTRADQAKRIVFENLLASSIERMLSVLDSMKAMEDYRPSEYSIQPNANFCCDDY